MAARRTDAAAPRELRARGLATRERLLEAGGRVFAARGIHAGRDALDAWLREFGGLYARTGPVIRAWTETEMVATEMGRLGTLVWAAFTSALVERIRATGVDGIDPVMAALALVAMIERANYYVLTAQAPAPDGMLPSTLARVTHGAIFGRA